LLVVLGWVGLGHTKWTHGQLCSRYVYIVFEMKFSYSWFS